MIKPGTYTGVVEIGESNTPIPATINYPEETMTENHPKTIVELQSGGGPLHISDGPVLVNGNPVAVASHGVGLEFSENDVTKVTLELLPDEVHFTKVSEERDEPNDSTSQMRADNLDALKHATAKVTKTQRGGSSGQGFGGQSQPDPWTQQSQGGAGDDYDEPPF